MTLWFIERKRFAIVLLARRTDPGRFKHLVKYDVSRDPASLFHCLIWQQKVLQEIRLHPPAVALGVGHSMRRPAPRPGPAVQLPWPLPSEPPQLICFAVLFQQQ